MAAAYVAVHKVVVLVEGLVCLSYYIFILFVRGEVVNVVGDGGNTVFVLDNLAVRAHYKAVLVYLCECGKRGDKAYVLAFGRLYGAHSAVVRVVNVAHFERRSVAVEAAGAEGGELTLMGELCGGVGLVHELREL